MKPLATAVVVWFGLCPTAALLRAQQTEQGRMQWGGIERTYMLRVPRAAQSGQSIPLVIALHGRGGNAARMVHWSALDAKADAEGFLLAAPDGTGTPRGWFTGFGPGDGVDDVGFIGALIDTLSAHYPVDRRRVYVVGHSNGGVLTHWVASELSKRIAAAAVVAGAVGVRAADGRVVQVDPPRAPVPMLIIHGDADDVVPYDARGTSRAHPLAASEAARFWARANECPALDPERDTLRAGRMLRDRWESRCRAPVVFLTMRGGDHGWPRVADGATADATDLIWEFFISQRR
jgi:polyhydroxybutyrate depolymerase